MITDENVVEKLQAFLENLRLGEFGNQIEKAFEELNVVVGKYDAARAHLRDEYLPELYAQGRAGKQQVAFIADGTLKYAVSNLAYVVAEALIRINAEQPDDEVVGILLEIILQYEWYDLIGVEGGRALRFESCGMNFLLDAGSIRLDVRLSLLRLTLRKYVRLLITEGPPSPQDLPSIVQRLNDIISLLLGFENKAELVRLTALLPFVSNRISYTAEQSRRLFGSELDMVEYEERLFDLYAVPLFPVIKSDKLEFTGNKIRLRNEGQGSLPPASIRVRVGEEEFELGELVRPVSPDDIQDLFVEEDAAFADFLTKSNPNLDVKVIFSFSKFGRSYDFGVLSETVGNWLERIPKSVVERAIPYAIPLEKLNEKEFERLCEWIVDLACEGRFTDVMRLNEEGGGERGRDVMAVEEETGKKYVFQCKRVKEYHPSDIRKELTTFARYVEEDPSIKPDVYVLFISCGITDKTKSEGDRLAAQIGMEIKYWTKSRIDRLVRTNEDINKRFGVLVLR